MSLIELGLGLIGVLLGGVGPLYRPFRGFAIRTYQEVVKMAVTGCSKLMGRPNTVINLDGCSSGEIMEVFFLLDLVEVRWCSGERILDLKGTISMVSDMAGKLWLNLDIEGGSPILTYNPRGYFLSGSGYKHNIISVDYLKFLIEDHLYEVSC